MNFPYIRNPLTNILRAYCDICSVFYIISRAFVDMYVHVLLCVVKTSLYVVHFLICGSYLSFIFFLALRSLRLTACGH